MSDTAKFRLDRTISLGVAAVKQHVQVPFSAGVPILMYHGIEERRARRHPYYVTTTSPMRFGEQVAFISRCGLRTCTIDAALTSIKADTEHKNSVAITFDDGYADVYGAAFPVLAEYRVSATVFVVTDWVGVGRYTRGGKQYVTWRELREMHEYGIMVGSHTCSHRQMQNFSTQELRTELRRSKDIIEDNLGAAVHSFSHPYAFPERDGAYVERLRMVLEEVGYRNGVCTTIGTAQKGSDHYCLPRLPINEFDDEQLLAAKLNGGYEWVHYLQRTKKMFQRWFQDSSKTGVSSSRSWDLTESPRQTSTL